MANNLNGACSLNTTFTPIDLQGWARAPYYYYFTQMLPTGYTVTVEVDITKAYHAIKAQGKRFFPAYAYVASKLIAEQQAFRIAEVDGQLGSYEVLHPSYACFHEDDKTMSNLWTQYHESFAVFYDCYMEDQRLYAGNYGILAKPELPPKNSYMIGMLPWIAFTSYTPIPFADKGYYFPVIQAGRFCDRAGRKMMPLSFYIHHAVADGYQVALFLDQFQHAMDHPEEWIES